MGLFSIFNRHSGAQDVAISNVEAPETILSSEKQLQVKVTLQGSFKAQTVTAVTVALIEYYKRHTNDFQQVAERFHEVKATTRTPSPFTLQAEEIKSVTLLLDLSLSGIAKAVSEDNLDSLSATALLHKGAVVANVLQLGQNKENVRYLIKTAVEVDGAKPLTAPDIPLLIKPV